MMVMEAALLGAAGYGAYKGGEAAARKGKESLKERQRERNRQNQKNEFAKKTKERKERLSSSSTTTSTRIASSIAAANSSSSVLDRMRADQPHPAQACHSSTSMLSRPFGDHEEATEAKACLGWHLSSLPNQSCIKPKPAGRPRSLCWVVPPQMLVLLLMLLFLGTFPSTCQAQQDSENPLEMYGGSVLAMAGQDAVVLVTDRRLGRGLALLDGAASRPVWNDRQCHASADDDLSCSSPTPWLMTGTGLPGDLQSLQTDVQAVLQSQTSPLALALPSSSLSSSTTSPPTSTSPRAAMMLVSHLLYQRRRYLVESVLVGFEQQQPMLCTMDTLGATSITRDYACVGGAAESLWGSAARYWQPGLSTESLIKRAVLAFGAGVDRNILSGYGAMVHILTREDGHWDCRTVMSRND